MMKPASTREALWSEINGAWDLLIIGGGITGAGILREAVRLGLRALLVEQRDFAWGTSSRSSKLVHGGFRYLKEGKLGLTRLAVHERQQLLHEGPGLIDPLGFLLTVHKGDFPGRWTYQLGLTVYDLLALRWEHTYYSPQDFQLLAPHITAASLQGGYRFGDAQTDDARLVLRVIQEAAAEGGVALNYVRADQLLRSAGRVEGARLRDTETGRVQDVTARVVINATGAFADQLRSQVGGQPRIRPLRGSHLFFPAWRLPVAQAVSFLHPLDHRPVFIFPWEGVTLVGTTDMDHAGSLDTEPCISPQEVAYLMAAVETQFPCLEIGLEDVVASLAGVRPVIGSGKAEPSQESRDHVIWEEAGLLTVTGGKLTTFRLIAMDVLEAVCHHLPEMPVVSHNMPVLNEVAAELPGAESLDEAARRRLLGHYGAMAPALVAEAHPGELENIACTPCLWAELRWAARGEAVVHLDDLLLRRTRLGLLLPRGGEAILPAVKAICQPALGWDEARWEAEVKAYQQLISRAYSLPPAEEIPDWKAMLADSRQARGRHSRHIRTLRRSAVLATLLVSSILLFAWLKRRLTA